jgi:hypothetical protein
MVTSDGLFGRVLEYPDRDAQRRLDALVGIDVVKAGVIKEAKTLLDPSVLERWSPEHYKSVLPIIAEVTAGHRSSCWPATWGRGRRSSPRAFLTRWRGNSGFR